MNMPDHSSSPAAATLILGLGATGLAAARWLTRAGEAVRLADTRAEPPGLAGARMLQGDVQLHLGQSSFAPDLLAGVRRVVLSPGLAPDHPALTGLLAAARARGVAIVGEVELFAQALQALGDSQDYRPDVLAVTGTNGKTTVTMLTAWLVRNAGRTAQVAGNVAPAALDALIAALDAGELPQVWVLELSSFQLEALSSLMPTAAAVLNVSEDHLDWHGSMQAYAAAKARIFSGARQLIVNRDDSYVRAMVPSLDALTVRSFGLEEPLLEGDLGLESNFGMNWLAEAALDEFGQEPAPRRRRNDPPPVRQEARLNRLMPADALRIRGLHNALNAQAALLLARSLGLPWASLLHALREYRGEPHRVEWLRTVAGVDFINDSKGTNVGATRAALEGLGCQVVLIAGGDGKGQDFSLLAPAVAQHARAVVLIGRDAAVLADALAHTGVPQARVETLPQAVRRAMDAARPGDAVLLSPACASLDMFTDYQHRARVFIAAVDELALEKGEV